MSRFLPPGPPDELPFVDLFRVLTDDNCFVYENAGYDIIGCMFSAFGNQDNLVISPNSHLPEQGQPGVTASQWLQSQFML